MNINNILFWVMLINFFPFFLSLAFASVCSFHFSWRHKHVWLSNPAFVLCARHSNGPNVCLKWSTAYAHIISSEIYRFSALKFLFHIIMKAESSFCACGTVNFQKILPAFEHEHELNRFDIQHIIMGCRLENYRSNSHLTSVWWV